MTVEEIFSEISKHMIEGVMIHAQMADYYNFLGLKGYSKCHEYHFLSENFNFRKLSWYYLKHFNKLIPELPNDNPHVVPTAWYKYTRPDVDANTRKSGIQAGIERWVTWEHNTKVFYQNMYKELINLNEIAAANEIKKYIVDVDEELAHAQQKHLENKSIDFDIFEIMSKQDELYKKYIKKIKHLDIF